MDKAADLFFGWTLGMFCAALIFVGMGELIGTPESVKREAVCAYLEGKMHGDVCIVDGRVVETKK